MLLRIPKEIDSIRPKFVQSVQSVWSVLNVLSPRVHKLLLTLSNTYSSIYNKYLHLLYLGRVGRWNFRIRLKLWLRLLLWLGHKLLLLLVSLRRRLLLARSCTNRNWKHPFNVYLISIYIYQYLLHSPPVWRTCKLCRKKSREPVREQPAKLDRRCKQQQE